MVLMMRSLRLVWNNQADLPAPIRAEMPFVALTPAARLTLWGMRYWATCARHGRCPALMLRDVYRSAGVPDAAASIDGLMRIFATASRRAPALGCPACTRLTDDEAQILNGVRALQRDEGLGAEVILTAWLPVQTAERAAPAMEGLARLLRQGGFDLACDRAPVLTPAQRLH